MQQRSILPATLPILLALAFFVSACSGSDSRSSPTQPTVFNGDSSMSVHAMSPTAVTEVVNNPICPTVTPFRIRFNVVVVSDGIVIVDLIRMQFTDRFGVPGPQATLAPPVPTLQFGTALEQARSQTFPLVLGIGCGTSRQGTVLVIIDARDDRGRLVTGRVTVGVS